MRLLEDVSYVDPDDRRWTARKGYSTDGASIPRAFWTVVGGPFEGRYRDAALIHDQFCSDPKHGLRTWQQVHRMFYFAMRASGVASQPAQTAAFPMRSPAVRRTADKRLSTIGIALRMMEWG